LSTPFNDDQYIRDQHFPHYPRHLHLFHRKYINQSSDFFFNLTKILVIVHRARLRGFLIAASLLCCSSLFSSTWVSVPYHSFSQQV
jgi:hypothetical protein